MKAIIILVSLRELDCISDKQVDGKCGPGRPKMTWKQLTERDCREWKLSTINPHDRHILEIWYEICRACRKPAIWKGAHWCGCCPCTCTLIKSQIMMMMTNSQSAANQMIGTCTLHVAHLYWGVIALLVQCRIISLCDS